jgi:spore photoproduct lyase
LFVPKLWVPRQVLVSPEALAWEQGRAIVDRAARLGSQIVELKANRLTGLRGGSAREEYVRAKTTLAVMVAPASARKLHPIPPSADWQFHIAEGCPAHCQYCYLAGSLPGPPVTRVYANLPEILAGLPPFVGSGQVTSSSRDRRTEGTTFEVSCYTDPLGIEHLTGSLGECIRYFGAWQAPVQLRWTTKFDAVEPLLGIAHGGKTRVRFSVNAREVARNFEGGTAGVPARFAAMRKMAQAGYPVGLTIAPIMPVEEWREQYRELLRQAAAAIAGISDVDLTVEMITHRFTPKSKLIQLDWYPKTTLDLNEEARAKKMTKFGSTKFVYPKTIMSEMHDWFYAALVEELPTAKILYWT